MLLRAKDGFRGEVWDLDDGRPIPKVIWVDADAGVFEAYQTGPDGTIKLDGDGNYLTYKAKARIAVRPRRVEAPTPKKVRMGAPECARCGSVLTLQGNDLCVTCNSRDRGWKVGRVERLAVPLFDLPCEKQGCCRPATYGVSDEVDATPEKNGRRLFERAATVKRRWYCEQHYRPPRILDEKGEVMEEVLVENGRPQWNS